MNDMIYFEPGVPRSDEAERSVIGALLLDNLAFDRMQNPPEPGHFFSAENGRIYSAIRTLIAEQKPADVVTVWEFAAGDQSMLAYLGELANNTPSAANIARYAEIVRDKAVERALLAATAQITERVHDRSVRTADKLDFAQAQLMALSDDNAVNDAESVGELLYGLVEDLEAAEEGTLPPRASCGFLDLDSKAGVCFPTDMIVIGGRPGMGKTTFGLNIAEFRARRGEPGLIWSGEMPREQIRNKLVASVGRVEYKALREKRCLNGDEFERVKYAMSVLKDAPIMVFDRPGITIYDLAAKARQAKRRYGKLSWILVDYLQLMEGPEDNSVQKYTNISKGLKGLAKSLGVTVYALAQLNRGLEQRMDKRPVMSDLRESGGIEQDADLIGFVYRDEIYNPESPAKGMCEFLIRKNRHGENGVMVPLAANLQFSRFDNADFSYPDLHKKHEPSRPRFSGVAND